MESIQNMLKRNKLNKIEYICVSFRNEAKREEIEKKERMDKMFDLGRYSR